MVDSDAVVRRSSGDDRDPKSLREEMKNLDRKVESFMKEVHKSPKKLKMGQEALRKTIQPEERDLPRTPLEEAREMHIHRKDNGENNKRKENAAEPMRIKPIRDTLGKPPDPRDDSSDTDLENFEWNHQRPETTETPANTIKDQEELKQVINAAIKKELKVKIDDDDDGAHDEPTEKTVKELKVKRDSDDDGAHDEPTEKIVKKQKVKGDADDDGADDEPTEKIVKKQKLSDSSEGLEPKIAFSASDVKDKYKEAALPPPWKAFQTIIFLERVDGLHDSRKIAAFDFDGCLADTSVKRTGADAWSLMYSTIPEKLQKLYKDGFKLVIFTNESNIERWKNKRQAAVDSKVGRLNNFIKRVDVPIQVFIACGLSSGQPVDAYRKPKPGMWHLMERHLNSGLQVDMDSSFYVGDAAGRQKDHSDADIKFAQAVGLKFYVPEEFFPNQ